MYDPDLYRDKAEIEHWKERDPLVVLGARMRSVGALDDDALTEMEEDVASEIDDAVAFAESAADEPVEELTRFVYSEAEP